MANVRVVWHCKTCAKSGYVDVRGKLEWNAIMDMVGSEHAKLSPQCEFNFNHVSTNLVPIIEPDKK